MIYYKIEMHHNEKTFESLSRMQYDLFCASNRITRTILSILLIAGGIINLSEWWGILLAAYGCYLTTSTYSSANHTRPQARRTRSKKAGMPFPASRYEFRENHLESILFRKTPAKAHWLTMNLKSWVRTAIISICSAIPTAGIWCRKRGLTQAQGPVQIRMRARI